ncbi:helix-turn-helix domain-containing protein [Psychrobacter sp. UBA6291]|uniref:helix-turn-helix domain-containing protein n=1 Tax=Psychrobacter sp. UBA6291 TaxID=1947357 RepID=UPI00257A01BB|nr:helix-turn-helix transcriptional regulator [Psychrobacter sp. UBA6291]
MDKYLEVISDRLAQERKKLGLEQTEVCKIVDISIPTLSRYENGKRSPDLVLSKRLSDLGYDIPYVITGKRLDESASDLTEDEMQWLELYRNSQRRAELVRLIKAYESME